MSNFYFTYGTAEHFPFHEREYVVVEGAESEVDAIRAYRKKYPDFNKGVVNCAFWYNQKGWDGVLSRITGTVREADRIKAS